MSLTARFLTRILGMVVILAGAAPLIFMAFRWNADVYQSRLLSAALAGLTVGIAIGVYRLVVHPVATEVDKHWKHRRSRHRGGGA